MPEHHEGRGRRAYRGVWTLVWTLVAAVGGVLSVTRPGWVATIGCAVLAAALAVGWYCTQARRHPRPPTRSVADTVFTAVVAGVALAGWAATVGAAALAIPAAALATMPGLGGWLKGSLSRQPFIQALRSRPSSGSQLSPDVPAARSGSTRVAAALVTSAPPPQPVPQLPVHELTDAELCRAWRASYVALEQLLKTPNTVQQVGWIARRQQYLDELEHRNPHGFHRWLQSGARPADDPSRYL